MIWLLFGIWSTGVAGWVYAILKAAKGSKPDSVGDWLYFVVFVAVWPIWSGMVVYEEIRGMRRGK